MSSPAHGFVRPGRFVELSEGGARITGTCKDGPDADLSAMVDMACAAGATSTVGLRVLAYGKYGFALFLSVRPLSEDTRLESAGVYAVGSGGDMCFVDGEERAFGPIDKAGEGAVISITFGGGADFTVSVNGGPKAVVCALPAGELYVGAYIMKGASISIVSVEGSGA